MIFILKTKLEIFLFYDMYCWFKILNKNIQKSYGFFEILTCYLKFPNISINFGSYVVSRYIIKKLKHKAINEK